MGNPPTKDAAAALKIQNDARAAKHIAALAWDGDLSHQASEYAKHLAAANAGLHHSSGPHTPAQGENLAWEKGLTEPAQAAAHMWIGESANYHGEAIGEGNFGSYGHYTQCMWTSTTHVGMGYAKAADGSVFIVGRYSPPGNIMGQKPF